MVAQQFHRRDQLGRPQTDRCSRDGDGRDLSVYWTEGVSRAAPDSRIVTRILAAERQGIATVRNEGRAAAGA